MRALWPLVLLASACRSEPTPEADAGLHDAGSKDVGFPDTGESRDAGFRDVGFADAGPTIPDSGVGTRLLLRGTVVTPTETYDGEVLVLGAAIACAAPGTECTNRPESAGAQVVETGGIIAPGLIDAHNHILFDIFDDDDWLPARTYSNHNQWPSEERYAAMLDVKQCLEDASQGKPIWCPAAYDGPGSLKCEMNKFGELKAIIAGTTSVVGLPGTSNECFSSIARSIDTSHNGLGRDRIQTSATFPPSQTAADGVCENFASGDTHAYLIHVGEGTDATALREWERLGSASTNANCLYAPQTVITHGTSFGTSEFATMAASGMKLTWSPASNVALYGVTTNVPAARSAGVLVTLAPDWSMGGSQNMLDELRFADGWDDSVWGDQLSQRDLVLMSTINAAKALAVDDRIGLIEEGYAADLFVVAGDRSDPYASIVAATPAEVVLVLLGGRPMYGDAVLQSITGITTCESLDVCGVQKFLCAALDRTDAKLDQTYEEIRANLEAALVEVDRVSAGDGYDFAPLPPIVACP